MIATPIPPRSEWWFRQIRDRVAKRYIRKHCHALYLSKSSLPLPTDNAPILVAMNHPSWWDPLIALVLSEQLTGYAHFGVMDENALKKYAILKKAGIFGIDPNSIRGAAHFLRTGEAILAQPKHALWVTAQGQFADVRKRPLELKSGVGHLAARLNTGWVLPLAMEIQFWNERTAVCFGRFGEALPTGQVKDGKEFTNYIEGALTHTMDALAKEVISRDASRFTALVSGRVGIGGVYDTWRKWKAKMTGRKIELGHDAEGQP